MRHECLTKGTPKRGSLQSDQFRAPGADKMGLAAGGREERQKGQARHSLASSRPVLCVYAHPLLHQMSTKGAPWARPHSASEPEASALGSTHSSGERKYRAPGGEWQILGKSFSPQDLENRGEISADAVRATTLCTHPAISLSHPWEQGIAPF